MITATLYHLDSLATLGRIRVADGTAGDYATDTRGVFVGVFDPATHYTDGTQVLPRTAVDPTTITVTPAAPVVGDTVALGDLPAGAWVRYGGTISQAPSGVPPEPGEYVAEFVGAYSGLVTVTVGTIDSRALDADPRWQALQAATPAQVESWLTANVTDLASARVVLKLLLLAVRKLGA